MYDNLTIKQAYAEVMAISEIFSRMENEMLKRGCDDVIFGQIWDNLMLLGDAIQKAQHDIVTLAADAAMRYGGF